MPRVFRAEGVVWGFASMSRHADREGFSTAAEDLLADLSEPVAQVFRRSALGPSGLPAMNAADVPGLLLFDESGVLESANEQAQVWLEELPQMFGDGGNSIRTELITVSMRARAIASGLDDGIALARIQGRSGRWLVMHGFPVADASDTSRRTALIIQPARPSKSPRSS